MMYILKIVCLLLEHKKIGYVVNIKTSMFSTEKAAMLYIRNHKISELSVEFIATFQYKLLQKREATRLGTLLSQTGV